MPLQQMTIHWNILQNYYVAKQDKKYTQVKQIYIFILFFKLIFFPTI